MSVSRPLMFLYVLCPLGGMSASPLGHLLGRIYVRYFVFYGVIVQLLFFDNERHNKPHIHIRYGEFKASVDIATGDILAGELPRRKY